MKEVRRVPLSSRIKSAWATERSRHAVAAWANVWCRVRGHAAKPVLTADALVRRDQNVEPVPLGGPEKIAVAQLVPTHFKGMLDFDAGQKRPQTARDAVIKKGPQAGCGTRAFFWLW